MQVTDHRLHSGGKAIAARQWRPADAAARCTIVLLHDSLGCIALWRDFPERLSAATGLPVIAYDRPGFGQSDAVDNAPGPDFIAEEGALTLPALCSALGLGDVVLLGHSVGGGMALTAAPQLGARCRAVITIAAQAFVEDRTLAGIREAREAFLQAGQLERLARHHGAKARWVLDAWIETWLAPAFAGWSLDPVLPGVSCPVLALHGDRDEYGSTAHPERIDSLAGGGAEAHILADCGHTPHRERMEVVLDAVRGFLASHDLG